MPRTMADKRERWVFLTTKPANLDAVTVTEANAGTRGECDLLASGTTLSASASDTINERSFCEAANAAAPTTGNAEGSLTVFRDLDPLTGLPVSAGDNLFKMLIPKGARVWVLRSKGPLHTENFVADHPYDWYEVVTDNKQDPSERGGYVKDVIPLLVQDFGLNKKIAAGA